MTPEQPPADPRVRAFLDALAAAVAEHLLGEIRAEHGTPGTAERDRAA